MPEFARPENLPFPSVYYTFMAKDKDSDKIVKYRVQDLPEEDMERAWDMVVNYYLSEEALCATKEILKKFSTMKDAERFWKETMTYKQSLACYREGSDDLVAVNFMIVVSKDSHEEIMVETEEFKEILELMDYVSELADLFNYYNVDKYLSEYGLCVHPDYRQRGIATEMLKARAPFLKALRLELTSTAFTVIGSQIAAHRANYDLNVEISYEELHKKFPSFDFKNVVAKSYKQMSLKI